jgi:hypothetical protein
VFTHDPCGADTYDTLVCAAALGRAAAATDRAAATGTAKTTLRTRRDHS